MRRDFTADLAWVQIDLSKAYPKAKQVQRRIGIAQRQSILIEDTVQTAQPVDVQWSMISDAEIRLDGQSADLVKGDWVLMAEIHAPRHAVFDVAAAQAED